ncbi:hypothetical protein FQA39_LY14045 [Lamprigera yunnana]|nr:hypothetical protein FQA39_LY14045 [Lamprigera yunnana]
MNTIVNLGSGSENTSILRQQNFVPNTQTTNHVDTSALLQTVSNDISAAQKGGQWILSCYAPIKERPSFPGLEDFSFEEVRWGYYEAEQNNTVPQYVQQLQQLLQHASMQMKFLHNPTPDIANLIIAAYCNSTFPVPPLESSNMFGPSSAPSSIFAAANQKLFGTPQSQTNSIFGNNQNIFGNSTNANQNQFIMQQQLPTQPFQQQPSLYPQQPFQQQGFGNYQPGPFSNSSSSAHIFKQEGNMGVSNNSSPLLQSTSSNNSQSIFGSFNNTGQTVIQNPAILDDTHYSRLEELTDSDIKSFESENFEFGSIPEKPPTIQMCS